MRKEYCYDSFYDAMKTRDEGFVIYNDDSIEFFERIEQADEVFENSPDALECGWVEEEVMNYFPELLK